MPKAFLKPPRPRDLRMKKTSFYATKVYLLLAILLVCSQKPAQVSMFLYLQTCNLFFPVCRGVVTFNPGGQVVPQSLAISRMIAVRRRVPEFVVELFFLPPPTTSRSLSQTGKYCSVRLAHSSPCFYLQVNTVVSGRDPLESKV